MKQLKVNKFEKKQIPIRSYINEWYNTIDCNPVGQRLPVPNPVKKREGIIESILLGMNIGEITIVKNDMNLLHAYDSIDGGHRKRYIWEFLNNKFTFKGKYYNQLDIIQKEIINNYNLSFIIYEPLSVYTRGYIFRAINQQTDVNHQEMLNSYGDIFIANLIRETVRVVDQIDNTIHELFELSGVSGDFRYLEFDNARLKTEELITRIVYRYTQKTLLGASADEDLQKMYEDENLDNENLKKKLKEHLNFLLKCANAKKTFANGLTQADFKLLSHLHFYLQDEYGKYKIEDHITFMRAYRDAYILLTSNDGKYGNIKNDECKEFDFKARMISEAFKGYLGAPDNEDKIKQTVLWLLKEFDIAKYITILDIKRSGDLKDKEKMLSQQNWKCEVDELPCHLFDAEIAHIISHANGGKTTPDNLVAVRKIHNRKMGTMNLYDYKEVYKKNLTPKTVKEVI